MGRKVNPNAVRMGINKEWNSIWYLDNKKEYADRLGLDIEVKKVLRKFLNPAGLDSMKLAWFSDRLDIEVEVARPGVAIGRGGAGIEDLQKAIKKVANRNVEIKIKELRKPDLSARVIARGIADGIERRQPIKLLVISHKEKAIQAGATGIKIQVSGRINNAAQARVHKDSEGPVPLQTLKAEIDYAEEVAESNEAGLFGVKVWVYRDKKEDNSDNQ
jgi:small subunit ribosomal protein S3